MGIERFYNSTAVSYREGFVSGSDIKKAVVEYLPSFPCHLQPQDATLNSAMTGSFGKSWVLFCPVLDFKEGDKIIVNGGNEYKVAGVETFDFGSSPHCEVVLRAFRE